MKNGVIVRKMKEMEETLRNVRRYVPGSFEDLSSDWGRQKIVERALQILVEAMVDIGERIVALTATTPCETSAEVMLRLQDLAVIKDASRYVPMVRFRNFLVHQYEQVDLTILYTLVTKRLDDFERFVSEIRTYVEAS
jgi:uncharacterized protein YutE (UPF0331/DUF86 family)